MDLTQFSLEGKVALITGGSRGIGEATALGFARAGADVVVTSRKLPDLERVAGAVKDLGRRSLALATHVGRMDQIKDLVEKVVDEFGRIDILVNNAATSIDAPAIDLEERAWEAVMNLDLKGLFFLSQAVARVMRDNNGGSIINISSSAAYKPSPQNCVYAIAKAGVLMATKTMAQQWHAHNIRVNGVAPGPTDTRLLNAGWANLPEEQANMIKFGTIAQVIQGRIGEPSEIADAILFLASNASSFITGQTIVVDGGMVL
ncbi:MAG: 3-oxoacyl-ACP reductase family protein [Desulfobacterales bacterium]